MNVIRLQHFFMSSPVNQQRILTGLRVHHALHKASRISGPPPPSLTVAALLHRVPLEEVQQIWVPGGVLHPLPRMLIAHQADARRWLRRQPIVCPTLNPHERGNPPTLSANHAEERRRLYRLCHHLSSFGAWTLLMQLERAKADTSLPFIEWYWPAKLLEHELSQCIVAQPALPPTTRTPSASASAPTEADHA